MLSIPQGHGAAGNIRWIENQMILSWIEPATFRPVAECHNQHGTECCEWVGDKDKRTM
jgi:hypothetical protein